MDKKTTQNTAEMRLFDDQGNRLYMTPEERTAFLIAARDFPARDRVICETLAYTGCRPSELIEITPSRVDLAGGIITLRSLKKRKKADGSPRKVFRAVPVPPDYLDTLNTACGIREAQRSKKTADAPIWPLTRQRVGQIVRGVMASADIAEGEHRCPKGLRHGYGINAIVQGIPLNLLSKWLGHESIETTAIYANALGKEERAIAERMWK